MLQPLHWTHDLLHSGLQYPIRLYSSSTDTLMLQRRYNRMLFIRQGCSASVCWSRFTVACTQNQIRSIQRVKRQISPTLELTHQVVHNLFTARAWAVVACIRSKVYSSFASAYRVDDLCLIRVASCKQKSCVRALAKALAYIDTTEA